MSLAINPERVSEILLADGWHEVSGTSFWIDAYEFVEPQSEDQDEFCYHAGGTGFQMLDVNEGWLAGPIASIIAVKMRSKEVHERFMKNLLKQERA